MSLDITTLKNNLITYLSNNGFNFDIMPNHIKYNQNSDGTAKINSDGSPSIDTTYNESAMKIILGSIADSVVNNIKNNMILTDISNIQGTPSEGDLLKYSNGKWTPFKGDSGTFVTSDSKTVVVENGIITSITL